MNEFGIHSTRCWIKGRLQPATIYVSNGQIAKVKQGKRSPDNEIIDVGDSVLMPGVIDAHVHVNEPGRTEWEGFETATMAAAAGGITTIVDMPLNASPVTTSLPALQQKLQATQNKMHVNVGFYGGLVPGSFEKLNALMEGGVLGIKVFLTHSGIDDFPNVERHHLQEAMPLIATYDLPVLVHCELSKPAFQSENNPASYLQYLESRPAEWEYTAIEMMIELCRQTGCATHIVHVSSAESLALIDAAKKEGLLLTAETCPHYIYFNAEAIPDGHTLYKCAPPIRQQHNNELLKAALSNQILDFIASDHSPAPPQMKQIKSGNLLKAWGGIAGLQLLLSASYTSLKDTLTIEEFIPLLTEKPAAFLHINNIKGFLQEGYDADLVVWNPEEAFTVTAPELFHRHKATPYEGKQLYGKVQQTYVHGFLVFQSNNIINKNAGKWVLRK